MGQPTQRARNYNARSNIEPAQLFLHANGQSAPRSGGARDVGRGAGRSLFEVKQYLVKAKSPPRPRRGSKRLRGIVFCPGGSAVWPQCWLCAVRAVGVGHGSCCVGGGGGGVPCGGKHIIIIGSYFRAGHGGLKVPCSY